MKSLQIKNVPEVFHERLCRQANRRGLTLRDYMLQGVLRELEDDEFEERHSAREPFELGTPAWQVLEQVRAERDAELNT